MLQTLDVALGLAFIFMLFSVLVSTLSELILSRFNMRGKTLWKAVSNMLPDTAESGKMAPLGAFLKHPLMSVMHQQRQTGPQEDARRHFPSYIPAWQFGQILMDGLEGQGAEAKKGETRWEQIQAGIDRLQGPSRGVLQALSRDADRGLLPGQDPLTVFQARLNQWYEASMDRTSGWYKRLVQAFNFFIGLTLAIACNLNTLQIVRGLSMDDKLRASFSERAIQVVQNADATATPPAGTTSPTEVSKEAARKQLNDALNEFAEAGFPIGWNRQTAAAWVESPITLFFSSILGWLLAAVAAALGAQFWFDLMKRLVDLRGSGVKPPPSGAPNDNTGTIPMPPAGFISDGDPPALA